MVWIEDDAGTVINTRNGWCYDYASELVDVLNDKEDQINELKEAWFNLSVDWLKNAIIGDEEYLDFKVNKLREAIKPEERVDCENCHHYNSLIDPVEGVFEQCKMKCKLHSFYCVEYDPIKE